MSAACPHQGIGGISPRLALTYGFGHFGKSLFWYSGQMLLAFFLTEIVGLGAARMGLVLAGSLLLSALVEPLLAWRMRALLGRPASAARVQWHGALLSVAALLAAALAALLPSPGVRVAGVCAAIFAFRLGYAFYDLPQNALFGLLGTSPGGHGRLAAQRSFFSGLAILTITVIGVPVAATGEAAVAAVRFLWLTVGISAVALLSAWCVRAALRDRPPPAPAVLPARTRAGDPGQADLAALLVLGALISLATSSFSKLAPYFVAYVLHSSLDASLMVVAMALGTALSQPLWARGAARWSTWWMLAWGAGLLLAASVAFLHLAPRAPLAAMLAAFLFGSASGGLGTALWSGFGQAVRNCGSRLPVGPAFAVLTSLSKLALAVGILLLGALLQPIDYRAGDAQPLLWLMAVWPATGAVLCLLVLLLRVSRLALLGLLVVAAVAGSAAETGFPHIHATFPVSGGRPQPPPI